MTTADREVSKNKGIKRVTCIRYLIYKKDTIIEIITKVNLNLSIVFST